MPGGDAEPQLRQKLHLETWSLLVAGVRSAIRKLVGDSFEMAALILGLMVALNVASAGAPEVS
jgi:hypothetical protein